MEQAHDYNLNILECGTVREQNLGSFREDSFSLINTYFPGDLINFNNNLFLCPTGNCPNGIPGNALGTPGNVGSLWLGTNNFTSNSNITVQTFTTDDPSFSVPSFVKTVYVSACGGGGGGAGGSTDGYGGGSGAGAGGVIDLPVGNNGPFNIKIGFGGKAGPSGFVNMGGIGGNGYTNGGTGGNGGGGPGNGGGGGGSTSVSNSSFNLICGGGAGGNGGRTTTVLGGGGGGSGGQSNGGNGSSNGISGIAGGSAGGAGADLTRGAGGGGVFNNLLQISGTLGSAINRDGTNKGYYYGGAAGAREGGSGGGFGGKLLPLFVGGNFSSSTASNGSSGAGGLFGNGGDGGIFFPAQNPTAGLGGSGGGGGRGLGDGADGGDGQVILWWFNS